MAITPGMVNGTTNRITKVLLTDNYERFKEVLSGM